MADLHILREHALGLDEIRRIAFDWAELAEKDFGMRCVYQEGKTEDELFFTRSGVRGHMLATPDKLEIKIELGILLRALKSSVEYEIVKNLDLLLDSKK